tara:strand:- start:1514 stop:1852 length:339 start_codon:yes stop_codon:yes gene_type:complete
VKDEVGREIDGPSIITYEEYERNFMVKVSSFKWDKNTMEEKFVKAEWVKPTLTNSRDAFAPNRKPLSLKKCVACFRNFKSRKETQVRCLSCQESRNKVLSKISQERLRKGKK